MPKVGPSSGGFQPSSRMGAVAEERRVQYNKSTKQFQPIDKRDQAKIDKLQKIESKIVNTKKLFPPITTSRSYLERVKTAFESEAELIKGKAKGVKEFFMGDAKKMDQFIASVQSAGMT